MRFMILVKATADSEVGVRPEEKRFAEMATYHEELAREEALEWTRRFPNPAGEGRACEIEVRQLYELEDFEPGPAINRFRTLGLGREP